MQNPQENICASLSSFSLWECNFTKKKYWYKKKKKDWHRWSDFCDFHENLRFDAVAPNGCSCSFPHTNLQEGGLCQTYTNTYL